MEFPLAASCESRRVVLGIGACIKSHGTGAALKERDSGQMELPPPPSHMPAEHCAPLAKEVQGVIVTDTVSSASP